MPLLPDDLITLRYLQEAADLDPSDTRLQEYEAMADAIAQMKGAMLVTLTTTTSVSDEIAFEDLCRRLVHQVVRAVIGKRRDTTIPILVIMENGTNANDGRQGLHAHILIGHVNGETRQRHETTFRSYLSKKTFFAVFRTLRRLTYSTNTSRIGRVGRIQIIPVDESPELSDYILKRLRTKSLKVAWTASTMKFQDRSQQ